MVCMLEHSEHCMEHCMMEPSIFCLHAHTNLCSLSLWGSGKLFSLWGSGGLFSLWGSGGLLSLGVWGSSLSGGLGEESSLTSGGAFSSGTLLFVMCMHGVCIWCACQSIAWSIAWSIA